MAVELTGDQVPEAKKRVGAFYRVSTKGQVDKDNDIPMQKNACRAFIDKQGWQLVKEYQENGMSGWKKSAKDRDELQRAMSDAKKGLYDVLVVFMFDRLGRKDDETPFVVEAFAQMGIEVWSVMEGQQEFKTHVDKLMNYIRFWQSSGESEKTSMRVREKHNQMAVAGEYRGGKPPYGYVHTPSGQFNKKNKELLKLVPHPEEAEVVKEIFKLAYEQGLGGNRICRYLNDKGIPSKSGGTWSTGTLKFLLRNPVYKGYMAYNKRGSERGVQRSNDRSEWILPNEKNEELAIVDEHVWDRVQDMRSSRKPSNMKDESRERFNVTKSPLLLVGLVKCGHCGSPLTTSYNYKTYTKKDGSTKSYTRAIYRCSGKALAKVKCDGQTQYAKEKIENVVLEEVYQYLDQLKKVDFTTEINKMKRNNIDGDAQQLNKLQKLNEENYAELAMLQAEVPKSLMGKSSFKPELLNSLIEKKESAIMETRQKITDAELRMKDKNGEINELKALQKYIPVWREVFDSAPPDKQKVMISYIIGAVIVRKGNVEISVKLNIQQFLGSLHDNFGAVKSGDSVAQVSLLHSHKFFNKTIVARLAS